MAEAQAIQQQILRASAGTISATFYDANGTAADPGSTTVGIVDEAGTVIMAPLTATTGSASVRSVAYTGTHAALLNRWIVTWTTATYGALETRVEVLGAFIVSIAEMRSAVQTAVASTSAYPTTALEAARAFVLEDFTRILGFAPVPRYTYLSGDTALDGTDTPNLPLPHFYVRAIRSIEARTYGTSTWTAFTAAELADTFIVGGGLYRESLGTWTSGTGNYRVGYEHGLMSVPADIRAAALAAAIYHAQAKNASSRAISTTSEFGTEQLWTPGLSGRGAAVHELPFVDRILRDARLERVVIG